MRKRNIILMLLPILLLALGFQTKVVHADETTTTPLITVIRRQAVNSSNAGLVQQTVPKAGVVYLIDAVAISAKDNTKLDLNDPKTFTETDIEGAAKRHFRVVTDREGRAIIVGQANLPDGYYRITEVGHEDQAVIVPIPYKVNGEIHYDVTIEPKTGLEDTPSRVPLPDTSGETTPEPGKIDETTPRTKLPDASGDQPSDRQKLLQTSGTTARIPYWLIAVGLLGALILGVVAANGIERIRQKEVR